MKTSVLAALVATASAAKTKGTFGVLRFAGDGPLMDCRIDPIVQPGGPSAHVHTFMGGNNIGWNTTGEDLRQSSCTNALPKADKSGYWFPKLYFKDPVDGKLEPVPMYYAAVYYFFEKSKDDIKAFPVGLKMVSGKATLRTPPVKGNILNLNPGDGPVSATGITCPRGSFNPPSWPSGSDGSSAGIGDPQNLGKGIGFPVQNCDGLYSPMRVDVHMPSCYNPAAGLENYQNNMAWPTKSLDDSWNCPSGHIHVPHLFFETYWNTQLFADRFKNLNGKESPWVFANGDVTGFSAHADFIAAWDEKALQHIIDTCNVEHGSLSECPGLIGGVNSASSSCKATCPVQETVTGKLDKLPGNNPLSGFKYGGGSSSPSVMEPAPADVPAALPAPAASSAPVVGSGPVEAEPYPLDAKAVPVATTLVPAIKVLAKEPEATPAPEVPEPAFAPAAQPEGKTAVVLETVTVWQTKTVYGSSDPTPVADDTKRRRRHVHDHMMHHRRRS